MIKNQKKLVIVCDEKTEEYANYLSQLIGANDDKDGEIVGVEDGTVEAVIWLENRYVDNKATLSSNAHVIFIGQGKVCKKETSSMEVKFEKHGIKYGWLGKRAMLQVDNGLLTPEQYDEFFEFCKNYDTKFEKLLLKKPKMKKEEKIKNAGIGVGAASAGATAGGAIAAASTTAATAGTLSALAGGASVSAGTAAFLTAGGAAVAAGAFAGAILPAAAIYGAYKGINSIQLKNKVRDQQYRAAVVIMYIDSLRKFLEE